MKKLSLKDNVNKLSRSEMKNIVGGDFGIEGPEGSPSTCTTTSCGPAMVACCKGYSCTWGTFTCKKKIVI